MDHPLQGCTATLLLVWTDGEDNFFAQCANLGDSACVMKYVFMFSSFLWVKSIILLFSRISDGIPGGQAGSSGLRVHFCEDWSLSCTVFHLISLSYSMIFHLTFF